MYTLPVGHVKSQHTVHTISYTTLLVVLLTIVTVLQYSIVQLKLVLVKHSQLSPAQHLYHLEVSQYTVLLQVY